MQNRYAIIVAGGTGSRMKNDLPKQFLLLNGRPIVMHTLEQFAHAKSKPALILVLHSSMLSIWDELCQKYNFKINHTIVSGGETRFQSVRNGVNHIAKQQQSLRETLITIHDAARPVISPDSIDICFEETIKYTATVLAIPSVNSVRQGDPSKNKVLDRDKVWIIQTPQTFQGYILYQAFQQEELSSFTDDASVVEKLGYNIHLIPGDHRNIKITFPEDIPIAQFYLASLVH